MAWKFAAAEPALKTLLTRVEGLFKLPCKLRCDAQECLKLIWKLSHANCLPKSTLALKWLIAPCMCDGFSLWTYKVSIYLKQIALRSDFHFTLELHFESVFLSSSLASLRYACPSCLNHTKTSINMMFLVERLQAFLKDCQIAIRCVPRSSGHH